MSISGISSSTSVDVAKTTSSQVSKLAAGEESSADSASSSSAASSTSEASSSTKASISAAGAEKSASTSSASSTKVYEKKDTDEDGTVTAPEELLYDIKHATSEAAAKTQAVSSQNAGKNVDVNA